MFTVLKFFFPRWSIWKIFYSILLQVSTLRGAADRSDRDKAAAFERITELSHAEIVLKKQVEQECARADAASLEASDARKLVDSLNAQLRTAMEQRDECLVAATTAEKLLSKFM